MSFIFLQPKGLIYSINLSQKHFLYYKLKLHYTGFTFSGRDYPLISFLLSFLLGTLFSSRYDHPTCFPASLAATCDHVICLLQLRTSFVVGKEFVCNAGDLGSIPGSESSPGEGNGHSSILAWRIPWREEPGKLQCMGSQESDIT